MPKSSIEPLTPVLARAMLDALLGAHISLEPFKRVLIEKTGGNPFFLEELVRSLAETDAFAVSPDPTRHAPELEHCYTGDARMLLASRIDRLNSSDKRLLQFAAVIGDYVPLGILQAVAGSPRMNFIWPSNVC